MLFDFTCSGMSPTPPISTLSPPSSYHITNHLESQHVFIMSIERVFKLTSTDEARSTYDEWAERYNHDMLGEAQDYVAPATASEYVKKYAGTPDIDTLKILDAGCGTGLVGVGLAKRGATDIHGIDLSPGMLKVARETGVYRSLSVADLSQSLGQASQAYDVVVCVGTMTQGHVGPEAFDEFVRVGKPGGFIVSTVRETV